MQDKTEWKLNGQVLVFTLPLSDQARSSSACPLFATSFLPFFPAWQELCTSGGSPCCSLLPEGIVCLGSSSGDLCSEGKKALTQLFCPPRCLL